MHQSVAWSWEIMTGDAKGGEADDDSGRKRLSLDVAEQVALQDVLAFLVFLRAFICIILNDTI